MRRSFLVLALAGFLGGAVWLLLRATPGPIVTYAAPTPALAEEFREAEPLANAPQLDPPEASVDAAQAPSRVAAEVRPEVPLLVAGTVVDDDGIAVGGAVVRVPGPEPRSPERRIITDSAGRFELRGKQEPLHAVVWASKPGYFESEPVDFMRGEERLKLVLGRGGLVAGRILLDPGIPMDRIEVRIAVDGFRKFRFSEESRATGLAPSVATPAEDGRFFFRELAAKTAKLSVGIRNDPDPLVAFDTVLVRKMGDPPDPALESIDLHGRLTWIAIDVRDDHDQPCPIASVTLSDSSASALERTGMTQGGRVSFLVPTGFYDAEVECSGWRRAFAHGVRGEQVIRLSKAIAVRIALDGNAELPKSPYRLAVGLLAAVHPPRSTLDGIGTVTPQREAAFPVSMPGRHELAWYLEEGNKRRFLTGIPTRTVDVLDQGGEQVLHFELGRAVRRSWEEMVAWVEGEGERAREDAERVEKQRAVFDAARGPKGN